ncbi:MAG: carboxymuconolactone decarboxylase family protein [Bacteroidota bacterium]|nr:carboxymuconolactone decarboxylase family protein [Bacteroidota bacterium]
MAHINLENDLPGIRGPMQYSPETGQALNELAEILLHDDHNTLPRGDRELIGAYVSYQNDCFYCQNVHGALAQYYFGCDRQFIEDIKKDFESAPVSPKLKALLSIAGSVQKSGREVTPQQIETAKVLGATDLEIHDTVLIAAAFCMFNRYVDGLSTWAPQDPQVYIERAAMRAKEGYAHIDLNK